MTDLNLSQKSLNEFPILNNNIKYLDLSKNNIKLIPTMI